MIFGFVFVAAVTGLTAAAVGMILLDLSFFWAATVYTVVAVLGFIASASIYFLRTNDQDEAPRPSPDELDEGRYRAFESTPLGGINPKL